MFSAYNLINRKLENLGYNSMEIVTYALIFGAIELLPFAPRAVGQIMTADTSSLMAIIFMGIGTSALAYYTWSKALTYADKLNEVTNYLFLAPFITAVLGWLMLAEIPGAPVPCLPPVSTACGRLCDDAQSPFPFIIADSASTAAIIDRLAAFFLIYFPILFFFFNTPIV